MSEPRLTFTLHRIVAVLDRHADRILRNAMDMTYSQFLFLVHLAEADGTSGATLADRLGVSRAAVSKRIPWFEQHGYVTTSEDPNHRGIRRVHLTRQGAERLAEAGTLLETAFRIPAEQSMSFDLDELHDHLRELLASLEASLPNAQRGAPATPRKDD